MVFLLSIETIDPLGLIGDKNVSLELERQKRLINLTPFEKPRAVAGKG